MGYGLNKVIPFSEIDGINKKQLDTFGSPVGVSQNNIWLPSLQEFIYLVDIGQKEVTKIIDPNYYTKDYNWTWAFAAEEDRVAFFSVKKTNPSHDVQEKPINPNIGILVNSEISKVIETPFQVFNAQYFEGVLYISDGQSTIILDEFLENGNLNPLVSETYRKFHPSNQGYVLLTQSYDPNPETGRVIIIPKKGNRQEISVGRHNSSLAVKDDNIFIGFPYGLKILNQDPLKIIDEVEFDKKYGVLTSISVFPNSDKVVGKTLENLLIFENIQTSF